MVDGPSFLSTKYHSKFFKDNLRGIVTGKYIQILIASNLEFLRNYVVLNALYAHYIITCGFLVTDRDYDQDHNKI